MKRHKSFLVLMAFLLALVLAGCSMGLGSLLPTDDMDGAPVDPTPSTEETTVRLYFMDQQAQFMLAEERDVIVETTLAGAALAALLEGPQGSHLAAAFPADTQVLSLEVIDGTAYVNFHEETQVPGSAGERAALRSLVLTLTELDGVDLVQILVDGRSNVSLGGHFELSEPLSRADVYDANTVPEIVAGSQQIKLFWPAADTPVSGSFEIWGIAQVFEAHLAYDVTVDGQVIAEGYTTASTFDWGDFIHTVTLPAGAEGDAVLRIYSPSAEDGSVMHAVEVPLVLAEPEVVAESQQIKVYSPAPGSSVSGSFEIRGIAQVYEATVSYDLTVGGVVVAEGFTTAWDFDWGMFRETVVISGSARGEGVLRLYSESAEDGSAMHAVEIPLTVQ